MTITADDFLDALKTNRIKWFSFADKIGRDRQDVSDWMNARSACPPYIVLAVEAVARKLDPASVQTMDVSNLDGLGVDHGHVKFWRMMRSYPLAARYAQAAILADQERKIPLNAQDRFVLSRAIRGKYYRVTGGWRSRPVLGNKLPAMRHDTPQRLINIGYLRKRFDQFGQYLEVTAEGKDRYYNRQEKYVK